MSKYDFHEPSVKLISKHITGCLKSDEFIEIRILGKKTLHGAFRSWSKIYETLKKYNGKGNIYFGLNPRKLSSIRKNEPLDTGMYSGSAYGEKDVSRINHILVDFDWRNKVQNESGNQMPTTREEAEIIYSIFKKCRKDFKSQKFSFFSSFSGNGFHLLIHTCDYSTEDHKKVAVFLKGIESKYGTADVKIDICNSDSPRICKAYGVLSIKKGACSERPNQVSQILNLDTEIFTCDPLSSIKKFEDPLVENWENFNQGLIDIFKSKGLYTRPIGEDKHTVLCPFRENHSSNTDKTSTTVIFDGSLGKVGFKCLHNSCLGMGLKEVLRVFGKDPDCIVQNSDKGFNFHGALELINLKEPEHEWLVDQHLLIGGTTILAGRPKSGKTELARNLAFCVSHKMDWLGKKTLHGRVLYLAHEDKLSMLQQTLKQMGVKPKAPLHVHVGKPPEKAMAHLKREILDRKPILVVIDTMLRFEAISEINDYGATNKFLAEINDISRSTNCHIMLIHHTGKGSEGSSYRDDEREILGSTALSAGVDSIMVVRKKNNVRHLSSVQRYGEDIDSSVLSMNPHNRQLSLTSEVSFRENNVKEKITDFLKNGKRERREIKDFSNVNGQALTDCLKELTDKKILSLRKEGKRHLYSLNSSIINKEIEK